jgi:hypothetical protein
MPRPKALAFRFTDDEREMIDRLGERFGIHSQIGVIRFALQTLDQSKLTINERAAKKILRKSD